MVSQLSKKCWSGSQQPGRKITIKSWSRGVRSLRRSASLNQLRRVKGKSTAQLQMLPIVKSIAVMTRRKADSVMRRNFRGQSRSISSRDSTHAIPKLILANTLSTWRCSHCAKWLRAECTITSAAGFIVTRLIVTGTCRTSRKCFTTRRSSPLPISTPSKSQKISNTNQSRATSSITSLAI